MTRPAPSIDEHHALHRLVYETSSDAIVWIAEDGTVLHANTAARELPWSEVEATLLSRWTRDAEVIAFRAELLARGRASIELQTSNRAEPRFFSIEGRTLGRDAVLMLRDVTKLRRLEEGISRLHGIAALGEFTASVVHDLGNLVTPMGCVLELLAGEVERGSHAEELVGELGAVTERARAFLRQLLSFVRRKPTPPTRVDVSEVLREMRPLVDRLVGEDVRVELVLDGAAHAVIDRVHFERVILNLAANARDAMPLGGKIVLRTHVAVVDEARAETLRCPRTGAFVVVSLTDDGTGMPPEIRARALDAFFTTKAGEGSGLGLAGAQRFVRDHDGCIEVRSEMGEGTMIALYLPRVDAKSAVPPSGDEATSALSGHEKILLVEDDALVRRGLSRVLESFGYEVLSAASGDDALVLGRRHGTTIDLVLADVVVPSSVRGPWLELLRAAGVHAPAMHVTAHGDDVVARRGLGDAFVLHKGFTPRELLRSMRALLDRRHARLSAS